MDSSLANSTQFMMADYGSLLNVTIATDVTNMTPVRPETSGGGGSSTVVNFKAFIRGMDLYFVPCVILVGLIGNCLSFLVFVTSHLRRQSSSVYLAALAVSDTGVLVCIFLTWSTNIGVNLIHMDGWCQSSIYFTYVWGFLSVWFVVGFTAERYIAVCHPLQRQKLCTTRKAKIVVLSLGGLALVLHLWATWTSGLQPYGNPQKYYCTPLMQYYGQLVTIMNIIDTVLTLILPSVAIVIFNSLIVHAVIQVKKQRHRLSIHQLVRPVNSMQSLTGSTVASCRPTDPKHHHIPNTAQMKVTKMLVIVSSTFLLLNLPNHSIRAYAFVLSLTGSPLHGTPAYIIAQNFWQYVYYINFSINFFLYNACGRNFRRALQHMCNKLRYKITRIISRESSDDFERIHMAADAMADARLAVAIHTSKKSSKTTKTSKRSSQENDDLDYV